MNYEEAITYMKHVSERGSRPGLDRVKELLCLAGDPQDRLKVIHVAGTNGKGSVCAMLSSIFREAGLRTGLFTSPYIWRLNECIRVDGKDISDADLAASVEASAVFQDGMEDKPTEFELLLSMALCHFVKKDCDIVILEAGMGGLMDATNVTKTCALSVITNIELDHIAFLGSTIREIAFQKAGLIKPGCPVIFGGDRQEAIDEISRQAELRGAELLQVDYAQLQNVRCRLGGCTFDFDDRKNLQLPLSGLYQPENAAIALTAVSVLNKRGLAISDAAVSGGLRRTVWYGRFEILSEHPLIIYDGAHNAAGMTMAVKSIAHYFNGDRVNILMGVMGDKDYESMVAMLSPYADTVFTVTSENPRALSAKELAECFRRHGTDRVVSGGSIADTVCEAVKRSRESGTPLIALGTLYMYEAIRSGVHTTV